MFKVSQFPLFRGEERLQREHFFAYDDFLFYLFLSCIYLMFLSGDFNVDHFCYSATWPKSVQRMADQYMKDPMRVFVGSLDLNVSTAC